MRATSAVLLAAFAASAFGAYTWYFTDPMQSLQASYWASSGSPQFTNTYGYWGAYSGASGGAVSSMVSTVAVPDGTSSYGVRATLRFPNSNDMVGTVYLLLRATSTFNSTGPYAQFPTTAYAVSISCSLSGGGLAIMKIVNGVGTTLATSSYVTCYDGMTVRANITDSGQIYAFINDAYSQQAQDSSITNGAPGIVLPGNNSQLMLVSQVQLGPADRIAPGPIPMNGLTYSVYSNHIDFQWQAVPDDANGTGVLLYQFLRDDQWAQNTDGLSWSDTTVQPGTEYSYTFQVQDYFFNTVSMVVNITVPPLAGSPPTPPDGRRVGVRSTGAYWGASPEQIDVLSGNLNYTIPLVKAQARTGWSVNFNLIYNSQNWRQDSGGIWNLGEDVGYGYGWKLLAGSLTPIWANQYTLSYYSFVDSTGAEYRLTQNNSGVWTSLESVYVSFDSNAGKLYFRDGTFWVMGCTSEDTADYGTKYPTVMEDTNGNQILVAYLAAGGQRGSNSSARISQIQDVRGYYFFSYNTDSPNHLTSVSNNISTSESYTFGYVGLALKAPFSPYPTAGNVSVLTTVNYTTTSQQYYLAYSSDSSGTLASAALPNGGGLAWGYQNVTYGNGATYREVADRQLSKDGVNWTTYSFTYGASPGYSTNQSTTITDPGGVGQKYWTFSQSGANAGMVLQYQGQQLPGPVTKTQNAFTWNQDNVGNLYIGSTLTTLDPGQSYQAQKKTDQVVDIYGNVSKVLQFDYNSLTTPARIYTYTYLNSSAYTSRYIFNRLTQATLGVGSFNTVTLATNTYDGGTFSSVTGTPPNWDSSYSSITVRGDVTSSTNINDVATTAYDQTGNPTSVTQNGITTQVTTNSTTNYAAPSQLSVGSLNSSQGWNSFLGITSAAGPNGDASSVAYDSSARPSQSTSPYGAVTFYSYSNSPTTTLALIDVYATPRFTKTILDGLGRTLTVYSGTASDCSGNGTNCGTYTTVSQVDIVYGSCACSPVGKVMQQSLPHAPNATAVYTTYTYDGIGRTLSVLAPDGHSTTTYSYTGNTVTVTDPAGKWKTFTMDAFGHLTKVDEPNPGSGLAPPVFPPTFSPAPGTYAASQTVTLSSATSGASIRYTTDGSTPSETAGTLYSGPFSVSSSETVNAIAYATNMADSAISSVTYTINSGGSGPAWYNTGWGYRKAITIAHGQVLGSSNLTNFPMVVSLASDSNLASVAQSTGNDILFTASDGVTKLNHEIELYTSSTGKLAAWVQIPTLSYTADTVIYMYYGNSTAGNQQNTTAVWDSNYGAVYHFSSANLGKDSTTNAFNFNYTGSSSGSGEISGAGQLGQFSTYSNFLNIGTAARTISCWFKTDGAVNSSGYYALCGLTWTSSEAFGFKLIPSLNVIGLSTSTGTSTSTMATIPYTADNQWHHIVATLSAGQNLNQALVYLDGVQKTTTGGTGVTVNTYATLDTGQWDADGYATPTGSSYTDEFRYSNSVRSGAWITTEYNNQSSPSTFYSVGTQQPQGGGGSYPTPVSMPTFSPAPGVYNSSVTITLGSSTSGASIRYTTNGTTPSETAGTLYTGEFTVGSTTTIKAIAYAASMADSEISTATFTISTSSGGSDYITTYAYDAWDNLSQVSMPRPTGTQTRTFTYNGKLLLTATNPENGTVTYTYNSYNKVATKTDAKGQAVKYNYDGYARLYLVQRFPTGITGNEDTCQQETYYYDTPYHSNYSPNHALGRLTAIQYSGGFPASGSNCGTIFTETYGYNYPSALKTNKGLIITRASSTVADLESTYAYDGEGRMTSIQYPSSVPGSGPAGPSFGYGYDTMGRLSTMTSPAGGSYQMVSGTTYDPANRLLSISGNNLNETREYNTMGQLTNITSPPVSPLLNITYNYSSTQNNGKIISQTDNLSVETVLYTYDALNRIATATATNGSWGQSYGYDGFGNLTDQVVTASAQGTTVPTLSVVYNASTDRQTTDCADANGNILGPAPALPSTCANVNPSTQNSYDVANRLVAPPAGTTSYSYSYAPGNKRVWRGAVSGGVTTVDEVTFWSVTGQRLAIYSSGGITLATYNTYFGGRLVSNTGNVVIDRLGSIGKFYPWGQEKPSATQNGTEKFTGYFRDAETGLDYADQRFHEPGMGRFISPDPKRRSTRMTNPGTWNRYAYVGGDPINNIDPSGTTCVSNNFGFWVSDGSGCSFAGAPVQQGSYSPCTTCTVSVSSQIVPYTFSAPVPIPDVAPGQFTPALGMAVQYFPTLNVGAFVLTPTGTPTVQQMYTWDSGEGVTTGVLINATIGEEYFLGVGYELNTNGTSVSSSVLTLGGVGLPPALELGGYISVNPFGQVGIFGEVGGFGLGGYISLSGGSGGDGGGDTIPDGGCYSVIDLRCKNVQ